MRSGLSIPTQSSILLIDDNPDGVLARKAVLETFGYRIVAAHSGTEAVQQVESESFDLIVTDFKMEPINGLELISQIRARGFSKPIILLSGFTDKLGLTPQSTGADMVLQKCASEADNLVRAIGRLLNPRKPAQRAGKQIRRAAQAR